MTPKTFEVWITKYALSGGIKKRRAESCAHISQDMIACRDGLNHKESFFGNDWHNNEDAAIDRAEEMRTKKIASLKKQIAKLEKMDFNT